MSIEEGVLVFVLVGITVGVQLVRKRCYDRMFPFSPPRLRTHLICGLGSYHAVSSNVVGYKMAEVC